MTWTEHAIFWHVYPLGFVGAPIRDADHPAATPRLRHLIDWLDYAVEVGANGLLLGPIHTSQTHGYDSLDLFTVDPRFGTEKDFEALIAACKERGIRVVLDGVFSHVGAGHPRAADRELFDIDPSTGEPRVFEGHDSLIRFNHATGQAADYVIDVMRHWLAKGIDGWRLDAAYSVPTEFWARVLPAVRADYPDAWFLGEVIHGDYSAFVAESSVDSVTQYELWKAIWSSLSDENLFELDWTLQRHNDFLATFTPNTFIGNHDVTRIATRLGPERATAALAILLTVGGIPSIYYGDEQGFTGTKEDRLGGDDEVRPAFPATPADLAPWGAQVLRSHQELIGLRRRNPWLSTARTEQLELANQRYRYRSSSTTGPEHLEVTIDLTAAPAVQISGPSGEVWRSPR